METRMHVIDFTDVPDFTYTKAWMSLDDDVIRAMAKVPQTLERARCALHFCYRISNNDGGEAMIRQGYMRASLAEFVGMEETLSRELRQLGITARSIKANSGRQPLLHIIRELRNFEIHLHSSPLSPLKRSVLWGNYQRPEEAHALDLQLWVIDDLTKIQFLQLANARHYRPADISQMIAWFNAAQKEWGVHDLIFRAIETFCCEIISVYSL